MDKVTFATLVAFVASKTDGRLGRPDVEELGDIVDSGLPMAPPPNVALVNELMSAMANGRKIDAIKAHRQLTGMFLKESKDAVEAVMDRHPF